MRITGGRFKGLKIDPPAKNIPVRPTSDKVRQAIFNILNHAAWRSKIDFDLDGIHVIDGFCGTGALGFESLSWGAQSCLFIDKDISLVKQNAARFKEIEVQYHRGDIKHLGSRSDNTPKASLVFLDPPYDKGLSTIALDVLVSGGFLNENAVIVIEENKTNLGKLGLPENIKILDEKTYGDTGVTFCAYMG